MMNRFLRLTMADLYSKLENVSVNDGQLQAACPLCESDRVDGHHFYAKETDDGKILMYCHRCHADYEEFLEVLNETESQEVCGNNMPGEILNRKYTEKKYFAMGRHGESEVRFAPPVVPVVETMEHVYCNPNGAVAYYKHRKKYADGHKSFYFYHIENGKQKKGKPDGCVSLYNLQSLVKASTEEILFIVEGEKCVDAMTEHGLLATTTNTGAQKNLKLTELDENVLATFPKKVVIGDNDDKGVEYVNAWEHRGACVLLITDIWPECPSKGDVADYFDASLPAEVILSAAKALFMSTPTGESVSVNLNVHRKDLAETVDTYQGNETEFSNQPLVLRCSNYEANDNGIFITLIKKQQPQQVKVSPIPLLITTIMNDVIYNREKVEVTFFKDDQWKSFVTGRETISSSTEIVKLAALGLEVTTNTGRMMVDYLATLINENRNHIPVISCTNRLGWHGDNFVPYYDELQVTDDNNIVSALHTRGSYAEWVTYVKRIRENQYLRLLMAASFASVLLEPLGCLSFVLHLWGGSGTGKTVGMMVAASVWGNPEEGALTRTLNSTPNAMLKTAAFLGNLPFFGNELQTLKARVNTGRDGEFNFDGLLYDLCEGMDRSRLNRCSELQSVQKWRLVFIFNGEEPIIKNNSDVGAVNRTIEIHCDNEVIDNAAQEGSRTANFVRNNYGHAGRNFLESVKAIGLDTLKKRYEQLQQQLTEVTNATAKQIMAIAALYLADSIVAEHIFEEPPLDLEVAKMFAKRLQDVDIVDRAYNYAVSTILEHTNNFVGLPVIGIETAPDNPRGNVWGKYCADGTVQILKKVLDQELARQSYDFNALKQRWEEKGYLIKALPDKYAKSTSVCGQKGLYITLKLPMSPISD